MLKGAIPVEHGTGSGKPSIKRNDWSSQPGGEIVQVAGKMTTFGIVLRINGETLSYLGISIKKAAVDSCENLQSIRSLEVDSLFLKEWSDAFEDRVGC